MHALNPSLLVLSITGFGHDGEIARSLHDLIGLASPTAAPNYRSLGMNQSP